MSAGPSSRFTGSSRVARHIVLDGKHMPVETAAEIRKATAAMRAIRVHTTMLHYGPLDATPAITRTGEMFEATRSNPRRPAWDEQEKLYSMLRNSDHGDVLHIRGATVLNVPGYADGFTINGGAIMSADKAASVLAAMPREKKPTRRTAGRR